MSHTFRQKFQEAPSRLVLDLAHLSNGRYLIDGDIHTTAWQEICNRINLPVSGHATARFEIEKGTGGVTITGQIHIKIERQCVRSLETFMDVQTLEVNENFTIDTMPYQETLDIGANPELDLGALISEQICLGINQYPVHPATLETPRGRYGLDDGAEALKPAKTHRPFEILEKLKH